MRRSGNRGGVDRGGEGIDSYPWRCELVGDRRDAGGGESLEEVSGGAGRAYINPSAPERTLASPVVVGHVRYGPTTTYLLSPLSAAQLIYIYIYIYMGP